MMVYFVFKGDKIDLYNTIFNLRDSFEEINLNYLNLIREMDSILISNLWVIPKIKNLKHFISELETGMGYYNQQQLVDFVKLKKSLTQYSKLGFTSYFEYECFGKLSSIYIPENGFLYSSPSLIIGTYRN